MPELRRNLDHSGAPCVTVKFAEKCGNEESAAKWGSLESS